MKIIVLDFKHNYSKQTTLEVVKKREEVLVKKPMENREKILPFKKKMIFNHFKKLNKIKIIRKIVIKVKDPS